MWEAVDKNKDGVIDYAEFVELRSRFEQPHHPEVF